MLPLVPVIGFSILRWTYDQLFHNWLIWISSICDLLRSNSSTRSMAYSLTLSMQARFPLLSYGLLILGMPILWQCQKLPSPENLGRTCIIRQTSRKGIPTPFHWHGFGIGVLYENNGNGPPTTTLVRVDWTDDHEGKLVLKTKLLICLISTKFMQTWLLLYACG